MINAYKDWLNDPGEELTVELWDGNSVDWDDSFYGDEAHFNEKGAIAFTTYLGERLLHLHDR